jgi:hypothetical protein
MELFTFAAASVLTAGISDQVVTPQQAMVLWSVAGTLCGAGLAAAAMSSTATGKERWMRAIVSFLAGLLLAPWAIGELPRAAGVTDSWHAFAASGIAASLAYVLVAEAPAKLRNWIKHK